MENKDQPIQPTISHTEKGDNGAMLNIYDTLGLTKREWMAGVALQGILSRGGGVGDVFDNVNLAVRYADRLISQLDESKS